MPGQFVNLTLHIEDNDAPRPIKDRMIIATGRRGWPNRGVARHRLHYAAITQREQDVLRLLTEDLTPMAIPKSLFISFKTVGNHRANIMAKLGLHPRFELVHYGARLGLVDLNNWKS